MYNKAEEINKETLLKDEQFLDDASSFLIRRGGYDAEDLMTAEDVYDNYMEHFRFQNVNEVTAINDMLYAQNADDEQKEKMARLMETYDKMDSDLGLAAAGDYVAGVLSAPSTYAGIFTGGGAKVGAIAAQQGIKMGIRDVLKRGASKELLQRAATEGAKKGGLTQVERQQVAATLAREAARKGAVRAGAVEGTIGGGQVIAQEQARVELDMQDDIRGGAVALGAAAGAIPGSIFGAAAQTQKAVGENIAERVLKITEMTASRATERANRTTTKKVFEDEATKETALNVFSNLTSRKKAIEETFPEVEAGRKIKETLKPDDAELVDAPLTPKPTMPLVASLEEKSLQNLAAFATTVMDKVEPLEGERFTSILGRALKAEFYNPASLRALAKEFGLKISDLGPLLAAEVSQGAKSMSVVSRLSQADKNARLAELDTIDSYLIEATEITNPAREAVEAIDSEIGKGHLTKANEVLRSINKARIGFMTIQLATTTRNVTNGFMRNYVYAFDNLGAGFYNKMFKERAAKQRLQKKQVFNPTDDQIKAEAERAVRLGNAQLRTAYDSFLFKDLFGITTAETRAMARLMEDPRFGKSQESQALLMEMGDVADHANLGGGLLKVARFFNRLNTKSDNMFKRAILSREMNKSIMAAGGKRVTVDIKGKPVRKIFPTEQAYKEFLDTPEGAELAARDIKYLDLEDAPTLTLDEVLKKGRFTDIDPSIIANGAEEALNFTYQTGRFKGREGGFNDFADVFIRASSTQLGSTFVPFPRYLVNQFRFFYEHAPLLGMINIGGIRNRPGKEGVKPFISLDDESFGKQVGGLTVLSALYGLRATFGDDTTGPFEYKNPFGTGIVDAQASLGPFSAFAFWADFFYRNQNTITKGLLPETNVVRPTQIRDFVKSLGGGQFRPTGLGVVDGLFDTIQVGINDGKVDADLIEMGSKFLGNYMNTYTVGAGAIKDIVATLDPDYRIVADNTDVEILPYIFKQATRSFPRQVMDDDEGFFVGRKALQSPTRTTEVRMVNPFMRQITGLSQQESRTLAEREFDRLGLEYFQVSPRKVKGGIESSEMTMAARKNMAEYVEGAITDYILNDPDYYSLKFDAQKKVELKAKLQEFRSEARARVLDLDQYVTVEDQRRAARAKYFDISSDKRKIIASIYEDEVGESLSDTKDYLTALAIAEDSNIYGGR